MLFVDDLRPRISEKAQDQQKNKTLSGLVMGTVCLSRG